MVCPQNGTAVLTELRSKFELLRLPVLLEPRASALPRIVNGGNHRFWNQHNIAGRKKSFFSVDDYVNITVGKAQRHSNGAGALQTPRVANEGDDGEVKAVEACGDDTDSCDNVGWVRKGQGRYRACEMHCTPTCALPLLSILYQISPAYFSKPKMPVTTDAGFGPHHRYLRWRPAQSGERCL